MPKEIVCTRCKDTRHISVKEGHFYKSIKCPDCNKEKEAKPKRPRGRPHKQTTEITEYNPKWPIGRPRKHPMMMPKGRDLCPVCKGDKRLKSKKWGINEICTACKGKGDIPYEDKHLHNLFK